jgi:hypothetical protein
MKRFTLFIALLFFATGFVYSQEKVSTIKETANKEVSINENTIRIIYADKTKKVSHGREYEAYINNVLVGNSIDGFDISGIETDEIEDINIISYPGSDTVSLAQMRITLKNEYLPKPISLTEIKKKYTDFGEMSVMFFINDKFIEKDYDKYMTDEHAITSITIDKYSSPKEQFEVSLIKIVMRTKKSEEKGIILRGTGN